LISNCPLLWELLWEIDRYNSFDEWEKENTWLFSSLKRSNSHDDENIGASVTDEDSVRNVIDNHTRQKIIRPAYFGKSSTINPNRLGMSGSNRRSRPLLRRSSTNSINNSICDILGGAV
jgi:hypothetical protein